MTKQATDQNIEYMDIKFKDAELMSTKEGLSSRWLTWLPILVISLIGIYVTVRFYKITYDDVFLAYRYAANILSGKGFVYNPGEHYLGTPAPLFVVTLVLSKIFVPSLGIPELGGLLSGIGLTVCAIFVYLLCVQQGRREAGLLASLLTVFSPFVVMTLGGETSIFLAFVCIAFYTYQRGKSSISAFFLAVTVLNRSEGIVVAGVIALHYILTRRRFPVKEFIIFLLALIPWFTYATITFGSPLTHSLEAKIVQRGLGLAPFVPSAITWIWNVLGRSFWALTLLPLAVLGTVVIVREWSTWGAFFAWTILQSVAYLILDVPFYHWYIAHLGLALAVACGLGFSWGLRNLTARIRIHPFAGTLGQLFRISPMRWSGVTLITLIGISAVGFSLQRVEAYHWRQPNPANRIYVKTGEWLRQNTSRDSSVAYIEIGQIGFYSGNYIVDLLGLVTPGVADHLSRGDFYWTYLFFQPDYVIYNPLFDPWQGPILSQPWFKATYEPIEEISESGYPYPLTIFRKVQGVSLPPPMEVTQWQLRYEVAQPLNSTLTVGQTFKANGSNLCGVEVLTATYGRENDQSLEFHLIERSSGSEILVTETIPASAIKDNQWLMISFPAVQSLGGEDLFFYLESPSIKESEQVALWSSQSDLYKGGTLMVNGKPLLGDLAFKVYACQSSTDHLEVLRSHNYVANKERR